VSTETEPLWTPPAGMQATVAREWRAFYASIRTAYGMTARDYRDLYRAQYGVCYICRSAKGKNPDDPRGRGGRRLGVDHNHVLGEGRRDAVRGLLCTGGDRTCNRIIGWLNVVQLQRAVEYVENPPAQTVFQSTRSMDWWERQADKPFPHRDSHLATVLGFKTLDRQEG
jgi:hypothetical protein